MSNDFVFPQDSVEQDINDVTYTLRYGGLTKRELAAMVILNGVIAGNAPVDLNAVVSWADALLTELEKKPEYRVEP